MVSTDDVPRGTLECIETFRSYEDDWEDGHRGISDAVADAAVELAGLVGPDLVFAVPFDGTIVLTRRWPGDPDPHGRSVEVQPDGLMSLVADYPFEDIVDADLDQPLDLGRAAAWLMASTREREHGHEGREMADGTAAGPSRHERPAGGGVTLSAGHDPLCPVSRVRCVSEDGHEYAVDGDGECFCPRPGCYEVYRCCPVIARVRDDQDERWERHPYAAKVARAARLHGLRKAIDAFEDAGLSRGTLAAMLGRGSGLVVVAGPTGSGKSTLVSQQGGSPERALPTLECVEATVSDAEAGDLVLGTLYTPDPLSTVERLVLMAPAARQDRWRLRLADALAGIVCTRLYWTGDASVPSRRVAIPEVTVVPWTAELRDALRADDWPEQLGSALRQA